MTTDNEFNDGLRLITSREPCFLSRLSDGRYAFVGRAVPAHLAFVTRSGTRPTSFQAAVACYVSPERAGVLKRTWATEAEAESARRNESEVDPPPDGWEGRLLRGTGN